MCSVERKFSVSATTGESGRPRSRRPGRDSTAPAPTEVSWRGSPTSTSRACGRTASSSRPIIVSSTIEHSSTTTTSYLSRLPRSWTEPGRVVGPPAEQPVQGHRVRAADPARGPRAGQRRRARRRTASCSRVAALPVGAASAIDSRRSACRAWSASSTSSRATVVVLPVPGPPVSTVVQRRAAPHGGRLLLGAEVLAAHPRQRRVQRGLVDLRRRLRRRAPPGRAHTCASSRW